MYETKVRFAKGEVTAEVLSKVLDEITESAAVPPAKIKVKALLYFSGELKELTFTHAAEVPTYEG